MQICLSIFQALGRLRTYSDAILLFSKNMFSGTYIYIVFVYIFWIEPLLFREWVGLGFELRRL